MARKKRLTYKSEKFLSIAANRYERLTGIYPKYSNCIELCKIIYGKELSKVESWRFIHVFCDGEKGVPPISNNMKKRTLEFVKGEDGKDDCMVDKAKELYESDEWRNIRVQLVRKILDARQDNPLSEDK